MKFKYATNQTVKHYKEKFVLLKNVDMFCTSLLIVEQKKISFIRYILDQYLVQLQNNKYKIKVFYDIC